MFWSQVALCSYAGPWGPLSATRQARDLYSSSLNGSPYSSYSEGLCADVSIGHFEDIQDQIFALKNQFSSLSSTQLESTQKQNRLADENQLLHLQVNSLEEQLRDVESKSVGGLDSEKRQLRERMVSKLIFAAWKEKSKSLSFDLL